MKKYNWNDLSAAERENVLKRPNETKQNTIMQGAKEIIDAVKKDGDDALFQLSKRFDNVNLTTLSTCTDCEYFNSALLSAIQTSNKNLKLVHQAQLPKNLTLEIEAGVQYRRISRPIERVGLYIPGGSAPLISTLLMLAIPAQMAGCKQLVVCTPANKNGVIDERLLFAAKLCGIDTLYSLGGAQAIAAMAYGTQSIPKVDKIFGPGNAWVTAAKQIVSNDPNGANCDLPAGPSEVVVIADVTANPEFVAADLLAQAEHGPDSQVLLLTDSSIIANKVQQSISEQLRSLSRINIIEQSLSASRMIITENLCQAIAVSNQYAPEHLILNCRQAENYINQIINAGAVFVGEWTPECLGDYVLGSNHVLPTGGYARSCSGLCTTDFMKFISVQSANQNGLSNIGPKAEILAEVEGLDAHKQSVSRRLFKEVLCD